MLSGGSNRPSLGRRAVESLRYVASAHDPGRGGIHMHGHRRRHRRRGTLGVTACTKYDAPLLV